MRLLVLASADVIHTRRWVSYFHARGHRVLLATLEPSDREGLPVEVEQCNLKALSSLKFLKYPLAAPALARVVKRFRPQLVNAHFVPGYGFLAALVPSARPLALTAWGSDILLSPARSPLHRWRVRFALRSSRLVTCDALVLSKALKGLGVEGSKILVAPMGIDPRVFHPPDEEIRHSSAVRLGAEGRPAKIISTRKLRSLYDVETLLRAAVILAERGLKFEVRIIGGGRERNSLEAFRDSCGLERVVTFSGELAQAELAQGLRLADIYVSTSRSDSTSVSLLEALASGIFPVVSDIEGNREWIEHGGNGLSFPPGDFSRLAEGLARAFENYSLREKARKVNLELVHKKALWEENMRAVEERFRELAGV